MRRQMLKSKIHRATVTDANVDYVGSVTIDADLLARADIREHEQVHVLDVDNGARLVTYAIPGGPGEVCLNGAAALLVSPGHRVIVITYAEYEDAELDDHQPVVVHVDARNRPTVPSAPAPAGAAGTDPVGAGGTPPGTPAGGTDPVGAGSR